MEAQGSVAQWRDYGRLWVFLRPYTSRLVFVLASALSNWPRATSALRIETPDRQALLRRDMHALAWISGALFVVAVAGFALNMLARYR